MKSGYKQTEVGVIPKEWEVKSLGEIGEALIGLTYKPTDVRKHGTLVLRSSNIQNDALAFDDNVFVDAEIPERIMVLNDDVLICVRNGSRDLIGKSALLDERTKGMTFGAFMAVYRSQIGKLASYLFQSAILKRQINEHLGATINQITNKSINSFRIPVPPVPEQRAIATVLSDMDAELAVLEKRLEKTRSLKQGMMQELLTGKTRLA
jgi:type I restriction enzyme S subunit